MDLRLRAFLDEPAMLVAAAADADGHAALARVIGARPTEDFSRLDLFISRRQWPRPLQALGAGAHIALTLSKPETYETYQVKGPVEDIAAPDGADIAFAQGYVAATLAHLRGLGVDAAQIVPWLSAEALVRVRMRPDLAFTQTPGPGAGRPLQAQV